MFLFYFYFYFIVMSILPRIKVSADLLIVSNLFYPLSIWTNCWTHFHKKVDASNIKSMKFFGYSNRIFVSCQCFYFSLMWTLSWIYVWVDLLIVLYIFYQLKIWTHCRTLPQSFTHVKFVQMLFSIYLEVLSPNNLVIDASGQEWFCTMYLVSINNN